MHISLAAMGESGTRIAETLGISSSTVETHIRHCLTKLEAKNRAHAIALGLRHGEIAMRSARCRPRHARLCVGYPRPGGASSILTIDGACNVLVRRASARSSVSLTGRLALTSRGSNHPEVAVPQASTSVLIPSRWGPRPVKSSVVV